MTDTINIGGNTYPKDDYPTIDPVKAWNEGYEAGVEAKTDLLALLREARNELHEYGTHIFGSLFDRIINLVARIDAALKEAGE